MTEPRAQPGARRRAPARMLRAARERQGLHIAALAATIKIPQRKLEALEADRFDELPDATFTRALAHDGVPRAEDRRRAGAGAAAAGRRQGPGRRHRRPERAVPRPSGPRRARPTSAPCGIRCPGLHWRCWWRRRPCSCCPPAGGRACWPASAPAQAPCPRRRRRPPAAAAAASAPSPAAARRDSLAAAPGPRRRRARRRRRRSRWCIRCRAPRPAPAPWPTAPPAWPCCAPPTPPGSRWSTPAGRCWCSACCSPAKAWA